MQNPLESQEISEILDDIEAQIEMARTRFREGKVGEGREWTWRAQQVAATAKTYIDRTMPADWRDRYEKKLLYFMKVASWLREHGGRMRQNPYIDNPDLPHGWKNMSLGDIVPPEALGHLSSAIRKIKNELRKGRPTGRSVHQILLDVLRPHEAYINARGVDIRFLAYSIENAIRQGQFKDNPPQRRGPVPFSPWAVCRAMQKKHGWSDAKTESCIMKAKARAGYEMNPWYITSMKGVVLSSAPYETKAEADQAARTFYEKRFPSIPVQMFGKSYIPKLPQSRYSEQKDLKAMEWRIRKTGYTEPWDISQLGDEGTFTENPGYLPKNPGNKGLLRTREMQDYDLQNDESEVRLLEMLVDSGSTDPRLPIQFWRDVDVYGVREAYLYLKGYQEQGLWRGDLSKVRDQVNKLLRRHGRTRFAENPYLVAGPQIGFFDKVHPEGQVDTASATPARKPVEQEPGMQSIPKKEEAKEVGHLTLSPEQFVVKGEKKTEGAVKPEKTGRVYSEKEVKRRRRAAFYQRRGRQGRFRNNPNEESYRPNPYQDVPAQQVKVYEVQKRGKVYAGFFSYDPSRQIVTVRSVERAGQVERVVELAVMADMAEARHMYEMLKRKGMGYFTKKVAKSGRVRSKNRYEYTLGEDPATFTTPTPYVPTEHFVDYDEKVKHAMTLSDQVRHEVGERDFQGALDALMRLHQLMVEAYTLKQQDLMGPLSAQWQRARSLVEGAWPGRVRFK